MQSVNPDAVIQFLVSRLAQKELEIALQAVAIQDLRAQLEEGEE